MRPHWLWAALIFLFVATPAAAQEKQQPQNVYNPAISVNGLFAGAASYPEPGARLVVQELEVQFTSNVDPYFRANLILALPEGEGIELEEGYVVPFWQPAGLSLRIGKMKAPFGRENILHAHALPFIDRSLVGEAVLGDDGLNEVGAELSWLAPLPFYTLTTLSVLNGNNEALFDSARPDDLVGFAALKTLFALGGDATLETGAHHALGNNADGPLSQASGAHIALKWNPARAARTRSAVFTVEALYAHRGPTTDVGGIYAFAQWQLSRRWYLAGRYDYLGFPADDTGIDRRASAIVTFAASEFSAIRLQANASRALGDIDTLFEAILQLNITIGSHPAHQY